VNWSSVSNESHSVRTNLGGGQIKRTCPCTIHIFNSRFVLVRCDDASRWLYFTFVKAKSIYGRTHFIFPLLNVSTFVFFSLVLQQTCHVPAEANWHVYFVPPCSNEFLTILLLLLLLLSYVICAFWTRVPAVYLSVFTRTNSVCSFTPTTLVYHFQWMSRMLLHDACNAVSIAAARNSAASLS
jgi:hypothetical protein